jgi:YD repeat-containing protein
MLSRLVLRPFLRVLLAALISGLIPSAARPPLTSALSPAGQLGPVRNSTALAQPQPAPLASVPVAPPANAHSSGLPASSATGIRAQYESHHTLNGVFDGRFATPRAGVAVEPGPFHLSDGDNPTTTFVLAAGPHQSIDLDIWAHSYHWYWGVEASIAVRPVGTTTWNGVGVFSVGGTDGQPNGASASRRITLGGAASPQSALEVQLNCSGYKGGECTFSNVHTTRETLGWRFDASAGNVGMPTDQIYAGVYAETYNGIIPRGDPFLGIDTTRSGGGASNWHSFALQGPLLRLPPLTSTDQLTVSVNWARAITGPIPDGFSASGLDLAFVTAGTNAQTIGIMSLPGGTTDAPWTRTSSDPLATTLSGMLGRLRLSGILGGAPRLIAIDAIAFYVNGKLVPVPSDQVVGKCDCNKGGRVERVAGDPVNTFSGAFLLHATDLALPSVGPALRFGRTYTSMFADPATYPATTLGSGWRHTFAAALTLPGSTGSETQTVIYEAPTGNRLRFYDDGMADTTLDPAPGVYATLVRASGTYTLTMRDQSIQRFNSQGQLIEQRDPAGHAQTFLYYSAPGTAGDGELERVTDVVSGRSLVLNYLAVNGQPRIASVSGPLNQSVQFTYTVSGDLATTTDLRGGITTYGYAGVPHLLTSVRDAANVLQVTNTYDALHRITRQDAPNESVTIYAYAPEGDGSATTITIHASDSTTDTVVIDHYRRDGSLAYQEQNGQFMGYATFDASFTPNVQVNGNGAATMLENDSAGLHTHLTDTLEQAVHAQYDALNRPVLVTDTLGIATAYQYDQDNNLTQVTTGITTSSSLRATTLYTYSFDVQYPGDSVLSDQRSADGVVTHYGYNAYGQVSAVTVGDGTSIAQNIGYAYDALGRRTSTTTGVGTSLARTDRTSYNADNTVASTTQNYIDGSFDPAHPDEDVTTTYGYDTLGRRMWMRNALGQYAVTHYDPQGQVDWTARNFQAVGWSGGALPATPPAYSPTQPDTNVATFYGYDGLGRATLVTETGILSGSFNPSTLQFSTTTARVTRTEYDELSRPVTVTLNY